MKTFRPVPIGGKIVEEQADDWHIVTVHYEGFETERYRAVKYNSEKVIVAERTFDSRASAEEYIKTKNEFIS